MTKEESQGIKTGVFFTVLLLGVSFGISFLSQRIVPSESIGATMLRTTSARDCVLGAIGAPPRRQPYVDWPCINKVADDWLSGTPNADSTGAMAVILRSVKDGTVKTPIRKPGEEEP